MKFTRNTLSKIMLTLLPFGAAAQSVHISAGSSLVVAGTANLVLNNIGLVNDGNFTAGNGTVKFTGVAGGSATSFIGGANTLSFFDLAISRSSGDVRLNQDVNINDTIRMNTGNLQLNNHILTLGASGGIAGEGDPSHITGTSGGSVSVTRSVPSNSTLNPGNIGLALFSNPGASGVITVVRRHVPENLPTGGQSIQRSYSVSGPANVLEPSYGFTFLGSELGDNDPNSLEVFFSDSVNHPLNIGARAAIFFGFDPFVSVSNPLGYFTLGFFPGAAPMGIKNNPSQAFAAALTDGSAMPTVKVYPNPAHDQFTVELVSNEAKRVEIGLYDGAGHLLQQKEINCLAGKNNITWDLGKFAAGVYYLSFSNQAGENIKIIKE